MALIEGCKHSLDIVVPVEDANSETERVVAEFQKRAKLPGFRPGKVPPALVRRQFASDIRQKVLENLLPKFLHQRVEEENLKLADTPNVTKVKFEEGEPIEFTAEFEVTPDFDLGDYTDVEITYNDPEVSDEDIEQKLQAMRQEHAEFVNIDPRPLEDGDVAVLAMKSVSGVDEPLHQDELTVQLAGEDTLADFTENLRGVSPGETKEFDVTYPEDFGKPSLAGKTVRFEAAVKGIRRKEVPELNDEFAKDVGDFQSLEELRENARRTIYAQRQTEAQEEAKNAIVEKLVDSHDFPLPEIFVERQIKIRLEQMLREMASAGHDLSKLKPDWEQVKAAQRDRAIREVKASLILSKISERESIDATMDDVDREVDRLARRYREPVAALKMRFQKDGSLGRIASQIQAHKTLSFLFERARKIAQEA
ncbi:MAG: trigger factor [Bryobacteraceae bacterium]